MSVKGRIKFATAGQHPLLASVRDLFISCGFALVPWDEELDLCLVGAEIGKKSHPPLTNLELLAWKTKSIPAVLLSSDTVYMRPLRKPAHMPYSEKDAAAFCWDHTNKSTQALYSLMAENIFWNSRDAGTLVLRPFNLYGPHIRTGVVAKFIQLAQKSEPLPVYAHYQQRSFLHEEDFFSAVKLLTANFVRTQKSNVYNVGSPEGIAMVRLADTIWGLTHGPGKTALVESAAHSKPLDMCKLPVVDKLLKTGWRPERSLRTGLREMIC